MFKLYGDADVLFYWLKGTLLFTLRGAQSGQPLDENELRRRCQQSGDIKATKAGMNPHKFVSHP